MLSVVVVDVAAADETEHAVEHPDGNHLLVSPETLPRQVPPQWLPQFPRPFLQIIRPTLPRHPRLTLRTQRPHPVMIPIPPVIGRRLVKVVDEAVSVALVDAVTEDAVLPDTSYHGGRKKVIRK